MNYFEKHIGDYIRDTVSLTMLEDGAYNRLMDQMYQSERQLPADKKMVYRLARATSTAERKAVDFVLETFFTLTAEGYEQKRIRAEIDRYQEKQRKAKASAEARWSKSKPDANAFKTNDASHMRSHSDGNAHQSPVTSHQSKEEAVGDATEVRASRIGEICVLLRRSGNNTGPGGLANLSWDWPADPRVTDEVLHEAIARAKKRQAKFAPNYLSRIITDLLAEAEAAEGAKLVQGKDYL